MQFFTLNRLSQLVAISLFSCAINAAEQPSGEDLTGRSYIGLHGTTMKNDTDRKLNPADDDSGFDHGSGGGIEYGYRISPWYEARISITKLNFETETNGYQEPSGSSTALDLLYFPSKQNFYLYAGADFLDVDSSNLAAGLGAGYRYYLSEKSALYAEAKGAYEFDDDYMDFSTKIGFIYYFGDSPKKSKAPAAAAATQAKPKDSDKDGVFDHQDRCANTPMTDRVNANGCTVFTTQQLTMELSVNFDNNKAIVKPEYFEEVATAAEFLRTYPHARLTINGHTSSVGDAAYNKVLSEKRAQAIVDVLVNEYHIDATRLIAVGHGEEQLLDAANTVEAHAKNRRIEANVVVKKKVAAKR
ncbi:OmpA family protein [Thalassotalea fusca]